MDYLYATKGRAAVDAPLSAALADKAGTDESSSAASWPPLSASAPCARGRAASAVTGPRCSVAVLLSSAPAKKRSRV